MSIDLPELELYRKKVQSKYEDLDWTVTPLKNNGKVKELKLGLSKPFILPKWQMEISGKKYVVYNIGFKHLEREILQNQMLLERVLLGDDPSIIKLTVEPELKKALEFLKTYRWETHDQVMRAYAKEKSEYLGSSDLFFLFNHDFGTMNSDVFVLLENPSKPLADLGVDEFRNSLKLTIQISYKDNGLGGLAPLFHRPDGTDTFLPFESRVLHYSFEHGFHERRSMELGGVSEDTLKGIQFWEDLARVSGGIHFAELTRYHSLGQLPRAAVLWFLGLAVTQAEKRGVDTFVASGDEKTSHLFSIFYGMKKFETPLQANDKGMPESLSYLSVDSPEFKAIQHGFLNP